ncbi:hypothetical protein [Enterococcus faecium]
MDDKQKIYDRNRKNSEALNFRVDKRTYKEISLIAEQKGISRAEVCRERLKGLQYEPPLIADWNGNSFFDKFYKVQNFFPYAIPIVLDNEPPRM